MIRIGVCWLILGLSASLAFAQETKEDPPKPRETPEPTVPTTQSSAEKPPVSATKLLGKRIPNVQLADVPLAEAFSWLSEASGANIVVRWAHLEQVGVERETQVSVRVSNLRLSQILWLIMNEVAPPGARLAYRADGGLILVSTVDDIGSSMITKVYNVRDLTMAKLRRPGLVIGRFREVPVGNTVDVAAGAVAVRPITGRFGSGVFLQGEATVSGNDEYDEDPDELLTKLIATITTSIEPDSWVANGGTGTIAPYKGLLVIRNTPLVHQRIGGALFEPEAP